MMFGNYYGYPAQGQLDQFKQPYMPQYQQQNMQQTQVTGTSDERIWVNGEGQARDYLIAPNSFVRLWDSNAPVFYEKHSDASGRPVLEAYEYKRRIATEQTLNAPQQVDYSEQIKALEGRIKALEKELKHEQSDADD